MLDVDRAALVDERGIAGDDEEFLEPRKRGDDVLDDAVGEVVLPGVAGHVREGHHGDRWPVGQRWRCGRRRSRRAHGQPIDPQRPCDVLDGPFAEILEVERPLFHHLVTHHGADTYAAGLGNRLQPCCDIDAVAQDVVAVDDDVAEIDADAELQPPPRLHVGVALGNPGLDRIGAIDGIHDAGELGQQPVACRIDDAATMTGNLGRKHRLPVLFQAAHGAFLVLAHQSAVANDIRRENGH